MDLLEKRDMPLIHQENADGNILKPLYELEGQLGAIMAWLNFGEEGPAPSGMLATTRYLISELLNLAIEFCTTKSQLTPSNWQAAGIM